MPEITAHPSREQLSAYNLGQLPPDEATTIESHISECEPCCDTIISLSSDDTFVGLLKEARELPTDQTADHGVLTAASPCQDIPIQLTEHARYEVLGLIGKGGMGDVYKARHRKMERTVALKVINRGLVRKAEAVDRFHREVKAAAQLSHPNIVTAYDADQAGDFHFMVMEYVDGVDLSQTVNRRGALPVAEACDYIRQAAIGLQHAHERGMVHRDIKPHNMMVTADGNVKILDFGLASLAPEALAEASSVEARGELTAAGSIMGTPDFISPEQAEDARNADIRSDIYSLGATLYYLLSGQLPFAEGSVMHKLKSHAQVEPEPLDSLRDDVPDELIAIVSTMMSKDPDERYLTPSEVAGALESFLRTYRPEEAESRKHEPSRGGDMSVSGGPKTDPDGMPFNWLSVWAKWFFYLSLLPIAILFIDLLVLSDETSVAASDRLMWYVLASIGLSSIAGVLTGVNQAQTSAAGGRRIYRLTTEQAVLIAAILIGAAAVYYVNTNNGVVRVEVNDPALTVSIQGETIMMTDGDKQPLTIRPGEQTLVVRKVDAGLEFETDRFQIRRGDEIAFKVELLEGEIVVRKDGEKFHATTLPEKIDFAQQNFERMIKVYAECKSYTDTGVIEAVVRETPDSPNVIIDHSFTTAFVRPGRLRFEIENEDKEKLLISANEGNIQTWWDLEPGIRKPASLDLAFAEALGFAGGNVGHIPALLMPQELEVWEASLKVVEPKRMYERKLENVECYCLEFQFDEQRTVIWIDKQSYLIRRIEQRINSEGIYAEWRSTFVPTINGNVTEQMLQFDPPSPRADDDSANTLPHSALGEPAEAAPASDGSAATGDPDTSPNAKHVSECEAIQVALRKHFMDKHPLFAASVNQRTKILSDLRKLGDMETRRQIGELAINSPVSEVINSFPGKPYVTFTEVTRASGDDVNVVSVNLYRNADGTCRFEVTQKKRKKLASETIANGKPITEEEVRKLVRRIAKDSDFTQLQGDWESVSVTEGGKQLATEDGFGGLPLQIQGNTFVIAERKPDSEKSEVDTGRIEINSTAKPKTIDFIDRAQPDNRSIGIYEIKDGALRICVAERNATDGPRGARIPDVKPLKRPTTFDSPPGSNILLMEFQRKQPDANREQTTRNLVDTTYISNDTVGLLVAHPQRILSGKSKVKDELHQMFAKIAESEGIDVRNLSQIVVQLGPPPLSSRPISNLFDEQLWTVILRFDEPLDGEAYIEKYAQGYRKAKHKHGTYYKHDSRMEMWFPDDRTLILAAERRILSLIDDPEGKGPMALRMRRADPTADLLLEIDGRQAGPLLLESLPAETQTPEIHAVIEQTLQKLKRITLTAQQSSDSPIRAQFQAIDAEKANELLAQAVAWLETAKTRWPKLRDLIRERPEDENATLANALADEIDSLLPEIQLTVDEDQLLVRVEKEGGVDLASLLAFFLLID